MEELEHVGTTWTPVADGSRSLCSEAAITKTVKRSTLTKFWDSISVTSLGINGWIVLNMCLTLFVALFFLRLCESSRYRYNKAWHVSFQWNLGYRCRMTQFMLCPVCTWPNFLSTSQRMGFGTWCRRRSVGHWDWLCTGWQSHAVYSEYLGFVLSNARICWAWTWPLALKHLETASGTKLTDSWMHTHTDFSGRQVGGKLDDLVAVTFLQQKFKAWWTTLMTRHGIPSLWQYMTVTPCYTLRGCQDIIWTGTADIFGNSDRSMSHGLSWQCWLNVLQGSHACCLLRLELVELM